jgi:hypothetical protein
VPTGQKDLAILKILVDIDCHDLEPAGWLREKLEQTLAFFNKPEVGMEAKMEYAARLDTHYKLWHFIDNNPGLWKPKLMASLFTEVKANRFFDFLEDTTPLLDSLAPAEIRDLFVLALDQETGIGQFDLSFRKYQGPVKQFLQHKDSETWIRFFERPIAVVPGKHTLAYLKRKFIMALFQAPPYRFELCAQLTLDVYAKKWICEEVRENSKDHTVLQWVNEHYGPGLP